MNALKKLSFHALILMHISLASTEKTHELFLKELLIGGASGSISTIVLEPVIYMKNRWQQQKPIRLNPRTMYRGILVNAGGFIPTLAMQNSIFGLVTKKLDTVAHKEIAATLIAGTASSLISSPRELLVIHQENNGGTLLKTINRIGTTHGYHTLWRGLTPIIVRNSSWTAFFFMGTPKLAQIIDEKTNNKLIQQCAPGMIAGALSALLTHPFDTLKTTMQADISKKSLFETIQEIYTRKNPLTQKSGIRSFYSGLTPRVLGVALSMTLQRNIKDYLTALYDHRMNKI